MNDRFSIPSRMLDDVRAILRDARGKAYTAVNASMVDAYWRIGRRIVEEEQSGATRAEYGSQLIRHHARASIRIRSSVAIIQDVHYHNEANMKKYDPEIPPVASEWLALDEGERIQLAEEYHRAARKKLPNIRIHAVFHSIVENQIAEGLEAVVRAMPRLMKQGLSRHDALHAIASVYSEHYFEVMKTKDKHLAATMVEQYCAGVERLTASAWLRKYK